MLPEEQLRMQEHVLLERFMVEVFKEIQRACAATHVKA